MEAVQWFDFKYRMGGSLDIPRSIADVALTLVSVECEPEVESHRSRGCPSLVTNSN